MLRNNYFHIFITCYSKWLLSLTTFALNTYFHIFKVAQNLKFFKLAPHVPTC